MIQFGRPPNRIDLLSSLGSIAFATAWRRRVKEQLHLRRKKIPLPILSLDDLVQSKRDAGRHKDLDDVEHLEAVRKQARRRRR